MYVIFNSNFLSIDTMTAMSPTLLVTRKIRVTHLWVTALFARLKMIVPSI